MIGGRPARESVVLSGNVVSGRGKASLELRKVAPEFNERLGVELEPGSLNVVVRFPLMLSGVTAVRLEHEGRVFLFWPATVRGLPVWVYRWPEAALHAIELVAPVHLRATLGLADGDTIAVELRPESVEGVPVTSRVVWFAFWRGRERWYYTNDWYCFPVERWSERLGVTQMPQPYARQSRVRRALTRVRAILANRRGKDDKGQAGEIPVFARSPLLQTLDAESRKREQVLNLLGYAKSRPKSYSASRYPAGYHTIELGGLRINGQRDPSARLNALPIELANKSVLDIGCNQGGMVFGIDAPVKWAVGIDFDPRLINVANRVKALRQAHHTSFFVFDLKSDPLELIEDFLPEPRVDVVFLLSVCMWIPNWRAVVRFASGISDSMLFESNGTEQQQLEQREQLQDCYRSVSLLSDTSNDDPGQKRRRLFFCTH